MLKTVNYPTRSVQNKILANFSKIPQILEQSHSYSPENNIRDVIVIGAGLAGLSAGASLKEHNKDVLILEARDRVGGRVLTQYLDDKTYIDLGAAWVGPTQDRIYHLLDMHGLKTFKTYDIGKSRLSLGNTCVSYSGDMPPLPFLSLISLDLAIKKFNRLSATVNLSAPWSSKKADLYDSMTLDTWLRKNIPFGKARTLLEIASEAVWAAHPRDISFLHALFYAKSGGDFDRLLNVKNGAQEERIIGGSQLLVHKMANQLQDSILLNQTVKIISLEKNIYKIQTNSRSFFARKVVIAIPPPLVNKIDFYPSLPVIKRQLFERIPMGNVVKTFAIYDSPFWRDEGLNGMSVTDQGHISVVFDNSPVDGRVGILMGFVLADKARWFMRLSPEERQSDALSSFSHLYGAKALNPLKYLDFSWADEAFSLGCYAGYFPTGVWTGYGSVLRQVEQGIHWAGTETATEWNGYMEGAIQSGYRVAQELLNALN